MICWNFYETFNLDEQDTRASQLLERLEFLGHKATLYLMQSYLKWLQCLKSAEPQGEPPSAVFDYLDSMKDVIVPAVEKENPSRYLWARFNGMTLFYYFGAYDLAEQFSDCCRKMYEEHNFGSTLSGVILFWECLVFLTIHRSSLSFWRRRHILTRINLLRHWTKYSYRNLRGKLFLIEAEFAAAVGDHHLAPSLYFSAVLHLRQSGLLVMEALANERAGKYFASRSDMDHASEYLREAIRLYTVWGSHSKASHLQTESITLLEDAAGQNRR
jgi:hypothetical protein